MKKYQVYYDRNVEEVYEAEFDTLKEAKEYCGKCTQGFRYVIDTYNNLEGRGNIFRFKVYDGSPVILDCEGYALILRSSVYETKWFYT